MRKKNVIISASLLGLLLWPAVHVHAEGPLVADGNTPTLTPEGTFTTPPPGLPLVLVAEDPENAFLATEAFAWGPIDLNDPALRLESGTPREDGSPREEPDVAASGCNKYVAGWYETNSASLYGGHVGIIPQNMPPSFSSYCSGSGMGYTDAVSFGTNSWIQAGLAIFPGELQAKWFCQSNNNGAITTYYGNANAYGNGANVYTWFSRDSSGVWRTYRYDTGPFAVQLPCNITRGASSNLADIWRDPTRLQHERPDGRLEDVRRALSDDGRHLARAHPAPSDVPVLDAMPALRRGHRACGHHYGRLGSSLHDRDRRVPELRRRRVLVA